MYDLLACIDAHICLLALLFMQLAYCIVGWLAHEQLPIANMACSPRPFLVAQQQPLCMGSFDLTSSPPLSLLPFYQTQEVSAQPASLQCTDM